MLTLYHFNDATCGIKARLVLEEKGIAFTERELTREQLKSPEYRALNPDGVVPTLVVQANGATTVLRESTVIMVFLDEVASEPALRPTDPIERALVHWWLKRIDDTYFPALGAVTYATVVRSMKMPFDEEKLEEELAAIPNFEKRKRRRDIIVNGLMVTRATYL